MLAHEQMAQIFGLVITCRTEGMLLPSAGVGWRWMAEGLESDDNEKDQPVERRSTKRRVGIVSIDEGKERVE